MVAYFQRHYDKSPQHTSILTGSDYMAEVRDGNPTNYHEMFCITLDLFYHLVDELKHYGYLKEGKGRVDVQEAVAIFLYIGGHNTRMRPVADRFQHSTETVDRKFTYVHGSWEGSANDSRVFEEAIKDPKHGFPWPPEGMRL